MSTTEISARTGLERRGRRLEYATVGWNSTEAVITLATGITAHSLGLVAFGLDSCVEVFASLVVLWQLRRGSDETRSARALRLIAASFLLLAAYLAGAAVHGFVAHGHTEQSSLGLAFLAATVAVMFALA